MERAAFAEEEPCQAWKRDIGGDCAAAAAISNMRQAMRWQRTGEQPSASQTGAFPTQAMTAMASTERASTLEDKLDAVLLATDSPRTSLVQDRHGYLGFESTTCGSQKAGR
ncbi:hypothetical protein NDU88_004744 [Pleurodeles waltl]|uniref:Uncharacterized protein n=1 Tax=Pleurodeles waltl TaxID=8319 RepID=A0AAV7PDD5_PLEWA|nr:hypothetical protein NDU88_004744 [Pleurodeles waltl]